jgi:exopolysaccharide production protein ExoQ
MSFSDRIVPTAPTWSRGVATGRKNIAVRRSSISILYLLENAFSVFALFLLTDALIPLFHHEARGAGASDPTQGDPLQQILFGSIYLLAILLVGYRRLFRLCTRDKFLLGLLLLAPLSAAWSPDPSTALRRSAALLGTTFFGMYLASRYPLRKQLQLLAFALLIAAVMSVVFAIALPRYGIMAEEHAGEWRGIFVHKNILGRTMALSAICCGLLALAQSKRKLFWWLGALLSAGVLGLSQSKTAAVVLFGFIAAIPLFTTLRWPWPKWRRSILMPASVFVVAAVFFTVTFFLLEPRYWSEITMAIGKDKTMTGRTQIWSAVIYFIAKKPWLGYGYNSFFMGNSQECLNLWKMVGWEAPHAHNGFLQLCLDMGLAGLTLFLAGLVLAVRRAVRLVRCSRASESLWPLIYLSFLLLYNLTEPTIMQHNTVYWVLYVAIALSLTGLDTKQPLSRPSARLQKHSTVLSVR